MPCQRNLALIVSIVLSSVKIVDKFDPYEYVGIVVPGMVLLFICIQIFPEQLTGMSNSLSIGDFGLALILAFVAGHLLQAVGNVFEKLVWLLFGGLPSTWPVKNKNRLLSSSQTARLEQKLKTETGCSTEALKNSAGLTREIYILVLSRGEVARIDKFNRNYGLLRGVATAFLLGSILILIEDRSNIKGMLFCLTAFVAATYRMTRFGIHYARELFVEYLVSGEHQKNEMPE